MVLLYILPERRGATNLRRRIGREVAYTDFTTEERQTMNALQQWTKQSLPIVNKT